MKQRPLSVSIISWFLIVSALLSLPSQVMLMNNPKALEMTEKIMALSPIPVPIQYFILYAGLLILIFTGVGMLRGSNGSRWLYVIWAGVGSIIGLATSPIKLVMAPSILFYFIILFFLFRPKANDFFSKQEGIDEQVENDI